MLNYVALLSIIINTHTHKHKLLCFGEIYWYQE